jgi:CelD/BcsL family acetyltransferase involved in cellulose biosynthesis
MSGFDIRVARTPAEVEAFRDAWRALPVENPAADPDHLVTLVEHSPAPARPHVILLEREGRPEALAVGRAGEVRLGAKLGYKTVFRPRMEALTISQGGLVGTDDGRAEVLLSAVVDALRDEPLDVARIRARVGSPVHALATTRPGALVRGGGGARVIRRRARLPETYAEYLQARSAKTRSNVKRYTRRLESCFGDGVALRLFQAPDELPRLVQDTRAVYEKTYQRGLGAGFSDSELARALRRLHAERGWLRAFVLYLDGVPAAFWHGSLYQRIFYTGPTGYDPEYSDLRLGTYVLAKMAEQLCGEADWMDFGLGDAEYKRHFGDESWEEEDVLLVARRPRPVIINLARAGVIGASRAGRATLARSGRLDAARRRWRRRLTGGEAGR